MTVLYAIGVLLIIIGLITMVISVNEESLKRYGYEFFSYGNLAAVSIGYAMLYFGYIWLQKDIANNIYPLNGELLMGMGTIIVSLVLFVHVMNTSRAFGLGYGIIQLIIYIPVSVLAFITVIGLFAWLMDTRPVYRI